ncbi:MAG: class I SAM-dependent methyltransferase [Planctomycetes bacterium]|nr:class I SAM-dependent methyltransferase [Planctomycetota bacterium]
MRDDSIYARPAWYEMLFGRWTADLPFYRSLASAAGGPILECGVGTGRVALELARAGHRVHGVDAEPGMLAELEARLRLEPGDVRTRVTFDRADVATMSLGRRFPLVLAPFNALGGQLTAESLDGFLRGVRRHLDPGGRFAFDVWNPGPELLAGFVGEGGRIPHPVTGLPTRCTERYAFDSAARVLTMEITLTPPDDDLPPESRRLRYRCLSAEEIERLLPAHGLRIVHRTRRFAPLDSSKGGRARGTRRRPTGFAPVGEKDGEVASDMAAYVCEAPVSPRPALDRGPRS